MYILTAQVVNRHIFDHKRPCLVHRAYALSPLSCLQLLLCE